MSTTLVFRIWLLDANMNNYTDVSRGAKGGLVVNINCSKLKASLEHKWIFSVNFPYFSRESQILFFTGRKEGKERRKKGRSTVLSKFERRATGRLQRVSNPQNKNILSHIQQEDAVRGKDRKEIVKRKEIFTNKKTKKNKIDQWKTCKYKEGREWKSWIHPHDHQQVWRRVETYPA